MRPDALLLILLAVYALRLDLRFLRWLKWQESVQDRARLVKGTIK